MEQSAKGSTKNYNLGNLKRPYPEEENNLKVPVCSFFLLKKKRYCRLLVGKNSRYCGQHLVNESEREDKDPKIKTLKRIPCPLDPKHSVYESKLNKHLKTCNARDKPSIYYSRSINSGSSPQIDKYHQLKFLSDDELLDFLKKIENCHKEHVGILPFEIEKHEVLQESLSNKEFGPSVLRHLKQNSSILGHLEKLSVFGCNNLHSYIEFGAGRGQLTKWITDAVVDPKTANFLLIDKGAQRHKFDAKFKYIEELDFQRVRIDIQDLDIHKLESIKQNSKIVVSGKHLCGAATDFSLRCITPVVERIAGLVIALCCHHRCSWQSYVGKEFLEKLGFCAEDFSVLLSLSSWAVSGSRQVTETEHDNPPAREPATEVKENRYQKLNLSVEKREELGRAAKQLLDWGRVEYLKSLNLSSRLVQYVSTSDTLENIAIVAFPNSK